MTDVRPPVLLKGPDPVSADPYQDQGLTGEELMAAIAQWQDRTDPQAVQVRRIMQQLTDEQDE